MGRLFLILLMSINIYASQYLPFILNEVAKNVKPPIMLNYGEITKVEVKYNTVLVLYIDTNKKVKFRKDIICKKPLFQDIIKEDGTIKYILSGKTTGTYIFNAETCKDADKYNKKGKNIKGK
jgi:hypothetical protein